MVPDLQIISRRPVLPDTLISKYCRRLAFLSPKLVIAILDGMTGQELTIKKLSVKDIPLDWNAQHAEFIRKHP